MFYFYMLTNYKIKLTYIPDAFTIKIEKDMNL